MGEKYPRCPKCGSWDYHVGCTGYPTKTGKVLIRYYLRCDGCNLCSGIAMSPEEARKLWTKGGARNGK